MSKSKVELAITWQTVTPESAENGAIEAHGFRIAGRDFELDACVGCDAYEAYTAREAIELIRQWGCTESDFWGHGVARFDTSEPQSLDYGTGADTTYTVHLRGDPRLLRAIVMAV